MGSSTSKAVTDDVIRSFTGVLDTSAQDCFVPYSGSQSVIIDGSSGVTLGEIDMDSASTVDVTCTASFTSDSTVSSSITDQVDQESEALSQGFSLNHADSETCARMVEDVATEVVNDYSQTLNASATTAQTVSITDSTGVTISLISMTDTISVTADMTFTTASSSAAANNLTKFLTQHSSATAKGGAILGLIIITIVIFVLFIGAVAFKVFLTPAFWFLISTILLLVFAYFTFAYFPQWWPYDAYMDTDTDEERADKEDHNTTSVKWYGGFMCAFLAFDLIMIFAAAFMGGWGGGGDDVKKDKKKKEEEV